MDKLAKFGLPLMLATVLLHLVVAVVIAILWRREKMRSVRRLAIALGVWDVLYLILLASVSLLSKPKVLNVNQTLPFCGLYLDCHLSAEVTEVNWPERIGGSRPSPGFRFSAVTVKIGNSATRAKLTPNGLEIRMIAVGRMDCSRNFTAEGELFSLGGKGPLVETIPPGGSYLRTLVFEVPVYESEPRLQISMTGFEELFLIGDNDSLWHAPAAFGLKATTTK